VIATLFAVLWWAAGLLTVGAIAYLLLALTAVLSCRLRQGPGWPTPPSVTLLKPLCGLEDGLEEALESFLTQEVTSPIRVVFGVADQADHALALARRVAARHPDCAVEFVVDAAVHGPNPKVSNLINMAGTGLGDIVMLSDSDIVITQGTLQRTIDALAAPGVGAVTALYRARPGRAGDRTRTFGAWFLDYWFLPMAVLDAWLRPLTVTYGPLQAIRGEVLEQIGGLAALADRLSDDAELGRLVHLAGWKVAFAPDVVETLVNDADRAELFDHELRWARTVRGLEPTGFLAQVVNHPGPLPLLLLLRPGLGAICAIVAPVVLRWLLARIVQARFGRAQGLARPGLVGIWLRDVFCLAVWSAAYTVRRVGWRGQRLAVARRDILQPLASAPDGAP
jgi:ceramide glucosyltransferase